MTIKQEPPGSRPFALKRRPLRRQLRAGSPTRLRRLQRPDRGPTGQARCGADPGPSPCHLWALPPALEAAERPRGTVPKDPHAGLRAPRPNPGPERHVSGRLPALPPLRQRVRLFVKNYVLTARSTEKPFVPASWPPANESQPGGSCGSRLGGRGSQHPDRKSTRLNSSH